LQRRRSRRDRETIESGGRKKKLVVGFLVL